MTPPESLRPLEDLKKRLEELPVGMGTRQWLSLAEDAIRLAEIYRDIAAGDRAENYVWTDSKAARIFKGEDGVK